DVLRLAVPPRHARAESQPAAGSAPAGSAPAGGAPAGSALAGCAPAGGAPAGWSAYTAGAAFLRAVDQGRPARAVWTATAGEGWPARLGEAAAATAAPRPAAGPRRRRPR